MRGSCLPSLTMPILTALRGLPESRHSFNEQLCKGHGSLQQLGRDKLNFAIGAENRHSVFTRNPIGVVMKKWFGQLSVSVLPKLTCSRLHFKTDGADPLVTSSTGIEMETVGMPWRRSNKSFTIISAIP